jgi:hypothetical protein
MAYSSYAEELLACDAIDESEEECFRVRSSKTERKLLKQSNKIATEQPPRIRISYNCSHIKTRVRAICSTRR